MTAFSPEQVSVRVPATSANLGPGFDSLGLALALYDEVSARITASGLHIEVVGEGGESVLRDESHLVVRSMRAVFSTLGAEPAGLELMCRNAIPHARGLGSSAAAIVAGVLLARALVADGEQRLPREDVLALCARLEGHADNVAPCLLGGFTVAWQQDGRARAVRRDVHRDVTPVALVPPTSSSTAVARGLLPTEVPYADAAFTAARAALLVAAITGDPAQLLPATEDRLHQPYRAPSMPDSAALVGRLRAGGLPAVISGAGPTVLVLARGQDEVEQVCAAAPDEWRALALPVAARGAELT